MEKRKREKKDKGYSSLQFPLGLYLEISYW